MNNLFIEDYEVFASDKYKIMPCIVRLFRNHELRYCFWGRKNQTTRTNIGRVITSAILHKYRRKYGMEIFFKNVGGGIRFIHPWNITINANATIKEHVTLYKGCTIGEIVGGGESGNPVIERNVTVYANATICENIRIGENSIVSAGSFVNFDVPENSIIIGNPGVIHSKNI